MALYPIIFLYAHNIDIMPASSIAFPLAITLVSTLLVWLSLGLLMRDIVKSGLIISLFLFVFFSYGHTHQLLSEWIVKDMGAANEITGRFIQHQNQDLFWPLMMAYFFFTAAMVVCIVKTRRQLFNLTKIMNVIMAALFFFSVANIVVHRFKISGIFPRQSQEVPMVSEGHADQMPDIYYIILDGYGRDDILKEYFGYDNSEFTAFLQEKGFYVASKSRTNFVWTYLSLASSLNYQYINNLSDLLGKDSCDREIAYAMIKKNKVSQFLKAAGYRYVHFDSTWGATHSNPFADIEIYCEKNIFQDDFMRQLVSTTILRFWEEPVKVDLVSSHLHAFSMLETVAEWEGPKFVFMHMIPPHHPYLFDREGNIKRHAYISNQFEFHKHLWGEKDQYIDQLIFITKKIKAAIQTILDKSKTPPIIILQSDHGPILKNSPRGDYLKARTAILNAFFLPGETNFLYDTITPVNTFRLIFNHYFNTSLPLLPDETFYSKYRRPWDFTRIRKE